LQAALQEFDLQDLLADHAFQLGLLRVVPALVAKTGKDIARPLPELAPPSVQDVGLYFKGARDFGNRGTRFQPPQTAAGSVSRVNARRNNLITQFSI
jgi:hypothetical protein